MDQHLEILTRLSQIVFDSANRPFEGAQLFLEVNSDELWVEHRFNYYENSVKKHVLLPAEYTSELSSLGYKLQDVMFEHTGGRWKWFTLDLDKDGKAKTHFEY
ncbi:MAG: hypothetical protein ABJG15_10670 [Hyphomonadaceae bacterium]